jgi:hypothetical protein
VEEEEVLETPECGHSFVEIDGRKRKKAKHEISLLTRIVSSGGHEFEVDNVPSSHDIINSNELSCLKNVDQQLKSLRENFQSFRFSTKPSPFMKSLLFVALASCPALPLYQAANIIPLIVAAFLVDLGVLEKSKVDHFCKSFPSNTYLLCLSLPLRTLWNLAASYKTSMSSWLVTKGTRRALDTL